MAKLIMLSGLPGSGKSTRAKELLEASGNLVRVNRDLLRTMLHFDKWSGRNEGITTQVEEGIVKSFLAGGQSVLVDDTNLNPRTQERWKTFATQAGADFQHIKIDTPWQECVWRDAEREKKVGRDVIIQMAMRYNLIEPPEKGYIICDLDGTLCDITHRLKWVKPPAGVSTEETYKKNWKEFFAGIPQDSLREDVHAIVKDYADRGYTIVLVSARPENYRSETVQWLMDHIEFSYLTLIMRKKNDSRVDDEVKQEILDSYFDKSKIACVIDDRPRVIRMWEKNGLKVLNVGSGTEF